MILNINALDTSSVNNAVQAMERYVDDMESKSMRVCQRLAEIGAVRASLDFSRAFYNGTNDVGITVEPISHGYAIHASGGAVLFIEFGSGVTYGYGHPRPEGYGAGTYPGKGHWDDPKGWWYGNHQHSYGNPPSAAMYNAEQDVIQHVEQVAREVFGE